MAEEMMRIKSLIFMLANRVEKLEKKIDALEEGQRVTSKKEYDTDLNYFKKELAELDKLI